MKHELLPNIFQLTIFFFSINLTITAANDSIYPGKSLSANQTLVSKNGRFELGYFTPGNTQDYYIGIWYKFTSNNKTIIWVANREKPVTNITASQLEITQDGNLQLLMLPKIPIWTSNSVSNRSNKIAAVLLDTGNFVVRAEGSGFLIWQSFENPTDTWLPEGWIGEHQTLTSWKNSINPSPGLFSLSVGPNGLSQEFLQWNSSVTYWVSGEWKGRYFTLIPEMAQAVYFFNFTFVNYNNQRRLTYTVHNSSIITRLVVDSSGQYKQYTWIYGAWVQHWIRPHTICDVYSLCGYFGLCSPNGDGQVCSCPEGYLPVSQKEWNMNEWSQGCKRTTQPNCSSTYGTNNDGFVLMPNMGVSETLQIAAASKSECELKCLSNCSCTAYVYQSGCRILFGGIRNLQQLSAGDSSSVDFYLRVSASDVLKPTEPKHSNHTAMIVSLLVIAAALIAFGILVSMWRSKNNTKQKRAVVEDSLVRYSYREIVKITKKFSSELGRGSFGPVFKGTLLDKKTTVAVKRLEGRIKQKQGEKQFRAEISTLGRIQHVNLIRLRGFCCRGSERLLVYDYMPNGSLDTHIFRNRTSDDKLLDWKTRYQIIKGISKGLRYLHDNCRECVVHCDVKPENVLLDRDMSAKVADFGMAKLMGRDSSRVLTTLRGTVGYLAPEWISGVAITTKVDVYGFGMMVFEIVSGWRNVEHPRSEGYFPVAAARELASGRGVMGLLDERLDGDCEVDEEEVRRACMVACWCVQDDESDRPTMEEVVRALEGVVEMKFPPPVPRSLYELTQDPQSLVVSITTSTWQPLESSSISSNTLHSNKTQSTSTSHETTLATIDDHQALNNDEEEELKLPIQVSYQGMM